MTLRLRIHYNGDQFSDEKNATICEQLANSVAAFSCETWPLQTALGKDWQRTLCLWWCGADQP